MPINQPRRARAFLHRNYPSSFGTRELNGTLLMEPDENGEGEGRGCFFSLGKRFPFVFTIFPA